MLISLLPNMTVIDTCDFNQTRAATLEIARHQGPVYLRFGRPKWPNFTHHDMPFVIGKAVVLNEGSDVSIFATGHLVWNALQACKILEDNGISAEIINIHTIKPLDEEAVLASVKKTRCVVTAEEHMRNGGLGDSIAQFLSRTFPSPVEMVAVDDAFGQSGTPEELLKVYRLDVPDIVEAVMKVMARKRL